MAENIVIQTEGLTQRYGNFTAVKGVNLSVRQGEIFGFLGPNGAGKTSTIRTILDFIRPASGHIEIFGMDSVKHSVEIRKRVGYLPSELTLWDNWTGIQYIRWLERVHQKPLVDEANRLSDALQYDLNRVLHGLSTGMKRKMGMIAALSHKPELLILDEPSNGLDPLMQKVFHQFMIDTREEGRTVFLSSHMLTEVEQICDRVGIIRDGELKTVATVEDLTATTFRWLTLHMANPAEANGFNTLKGVSDVTANGKSIKMKVNGSANMREVLRQAVEHDIQDIDLVKPTLEEIFLSFYGEKGE